MLTLPTQPNAVRLRLWRTLKGLGCASLRDGTYLLPREQAALLEPLAAEAREHGGQATVFDLVPRSETQQQELLALFDRSEQYAQWRTEVDALHAALPDLDEAEARRRARALAEALQALQRTDYLPGPAADQATTHLAGLRQAIDARFSPGEPVAEDVHGIPRLDTRKHRGRRWATRARPWVDRLACAWLIRRFIDPAATFVWLADPMRAPRGVLGFDYDGARFTHVGSRVTFEVMALSFGLDADPRLQRVAQLVHFLDVGGIPVAEAAGVEAVLAGLREVHADDDRLVEAAATVFDALHAAPAPTRRKEG